MESLKMRTKMFAAAAAAIVASAALPSLAAPAQPDLIVKFSTSNGRVQLRNIGNKKSKKALVTIVCKKISGRGSCPDPNPKKVAKYLNPAFPNAAVVKFGPIKPGKRKNHVLNFWPGLVFASGKYQFTLIADASNNNIESDEANTTIAIKTVP